MAKLLDLTEQNTIQTKQIMDGFITDLKDLLIRNSEDQSKRISNAIIETFSGSLDRVSNAMNDTNQILGTLDKYVSSSQQAAGEVTERVANDICSVIQVMREEMEEFKTAISDSALKLTTATEKLENVTGNYSSAVQQVGENSKQQVADLMRSMQSVVDQLATRCVGMTDQFKMAFENQVVASGKSLKETTNVTQTVINQLALSVENMNEMFNSTCKKLSDQTAQHVHGMEESTKKAVEGFLQTVNHLNEELGKTFSSIMVCQTQIDRIVTKVTDVSTSLSSSAEQSKDVSNQFSAAMELQAKNLSELSSIISNFTDSLSRCDDVVLQLYDIAEKVQESNKETEVFAKDAADNLSKVFNEFQTGTQRVGNEVCAQCDNLMQIAYTKLDSSINELKGTLEDFTDELEETRTSRKRASKNV